MLSLRENLKKDQDTDIQETVEDKIDDIYSSNDGHESHDDIVREMEDTDNQPELLRDPDWTLDEECNGNGNGENFSDDDAADDEEKEEHQNKSSRNEVRYSFHIAT